MSVGILGEDDGTQQQVEIEHGGEGILKTRSPVVGAVDLEQGNSW
jgi:hypothetical protein